MLETAEDVSELQSLIDASREAAQSEQLRDIFAPSMYLTAQEVIDLFPAQRIGAMATVSSRGEPYVAPIDVILVRGRFIFGTTARALRARHIRRNRSVSLTVYDGEEWAIVAHGEVAVITMDDPEFDRIDEVWKQIYGSSARSLAPDVVFFRLEPRRLFTRSAAKMVS